MSVSRESTTATFDAVAAQVVGRRHELMLVLAAVAAGRDVLLEGPPGTSKSTLLRAITEQWQAPLVFVEGNADLTPARLIGHHNPARVLREDYTAENFVDGPLLQAMRGGGLLYLEELNRAPDDTVNTLLTAMAERRVEVPRVGSVAAADGFLVVATMNPFDNVGTSRLSTSIYDRMCRLALGYQSLEEECSITHRRDEEATGTPRDDLADTLVSDAVTLTRATREHADIRQGSSVRGAIDLTLVARRLMELQKVSGTDGDARPAYVELIFDAMVLALSGRIHLDETTDATPEQVLREIWEDHFVLSPAAAEPG